MDPCPQFLVHPLSRHPEDLCYFTDVHDGEIVRKRGRLLQFFQHAVAEQ